MISVVGSSRVGRILAALVSGLCVSGCALIFRIPHHVPTVETGETHKRTNMKTHPPHLLQALACVVLLCLGACSKPTDPVTPTTLSPIDSPTLPARGFFMGILPMPATGQTLEQSYPQAAQHAEFVPVWAVGLGARGFWDYAEALAGFGGDAIVGGLIRDNGMFPLIHFSFIDSDTLTGDLILQAPPGLSGATLSDSTWRRAYKDEVLAAVRAIRPRYLSTGNEVNRWYEQHGSQADNPNGFQHWVSLHEEIYAAAKQLSPQTQVFCVFAREVVDELREADLSFLEMFDAAHQDLVVFTSYPNAVKKDAAGAMLPNPINRPSDIPEAYYEPIHVFAQGKPIGFSEIAWPSENGFGGEQDQADFLARAATTLTVNRGMNLKLFGWPWLHNLTNPVTGEEESSGLITRASHEKLAYTAWRNLANAGR